MTKRIIPHAAPVLAFALFFLARTPAADGGAILDLADKGDPLSLVLYLDMRREGAGANLDGAVAGAAEPRRRELAAQLDRLAALVEEAQKGAAAILGGPDALPELFDELEESAHGRSEPEAELARAAAGMIEAAAVAAATTLEQREKILAAYHDEARRGGVGPGTRMAWAILRAGMGDPETGLLPYSLRQNGRRVEARLTVAGVPLHVSMTYDDFEKRVRASAFGYSFTAGWALLFQKPFRWMAELASAMRSAGVDAARHPEWEVMEGGGGLVAVTPEGGSGGGPRMAFYRGLLSPVEEFPRPAGADRLDDDFMAAAKRLRETVMADASISRRLRQALDPVLAGAYLPVDARDYFDSAFCRRLLEADYLEAFIRPLPAAVAGALADYRAALAAIEVGSDRFAIALPDGGRLTAVATIDLDAGGSGRPDDRDTDTGETIPAYVWRLEGGGETVFYSPLPARSIYSLSLAERYPGGHAIRPPGTPLLVETVHPVLGTLLSHRRGDGRAVGDPAAWKAALDLDRRGGSDASAGHLDWAFPAHTLIRDDQGDPVALATPGGVIPSPDFSSPDDPERLRRAEDEWLDNAARVLSTPGELALIFHQFFRYCSDSPLPELPNLIGSHYGLSDTHQTVYQSLERRWVGRLIGDCDDLAEFFQVLTRRQGKLSHVMQLPGHAACGYVDRLPDGGYRFVVLQTGPALRFDSPTLTGAVEAAYLRTGDDSGSNHFNPAAVPLLLRFADEDTRTPFVLSARIYEDAEYAEAMIRIQGYWHLHVYSAAVREMEEMIRTDRELGNLKELGSLYQRVGRYGDSARLRREELEAAGDDVQARLSALDDLAQLHIQAKDRDAALATLARMEELFASLPDDETDGDSFFRFMPLRLFWAARMARMERPEAAWAVIRRDVAALKRLTGRVSDPLLATMTTLHARSERMRNAPAGGAPDDLRKEMDAALAKGYFRADDAYTTVIRRYHLVGRYTVSREGRPAGLARLEEDGPYPSGPKDHARRGGGITDADWEWFRITPSLYLSLAEEMLDRDERPDLYDPAGARPLLLGVGRAVEKGFGLGSDVAGADDAVRASLILSFVDRDLDAFREALAEVQARNYASLYGDAAMTFGAYCGLVPLEEFPAWMEAFRRFFPGRQHYFRVAYQALDKGYYDHALAAAEATAGYFPEDELLAREADFLRGMVPLLKAGEAERRERDGDGDRPEEKPGAGAEPPTREGGAGEGAK